MKYIKLLLLGSLILTTQISANAQSFFIDSSEYNLYLQTGERAYGSHWLKEKLILDSIGEIGEFYSVYLASMKINDSYFTPLLPPLNSKYNLRVKNDSVFMTGLIKKPNASTDSLFTNLLLYDFSMQVGDSLHIYLPYIGLDSNYVLDSIIPILYPDDSLRETYYLSKILENGKRNKISWIKGLGSLGGLNKYSPKFYYSMSYFLISVCKNGNPIFIHNFGILNFSGYCSDEELDKIIIDYYTQYVTIKDLLKNEIIAIYPNPASEEITLTREGNPQSTQVQVYDMQGKKIFSTEWKDASIKINTQEWRNGIYTVRIGEQIVRKVVIQK
jgi:hypothetical protein